jgi:hypothetical protein
MTVLKKTVTTIETTVPGDRPGQWVTRTERTVETEERFPIDDMIAGYRPEGREPQQGR